MDRNSSETYTLANPHLSRKPGSTPNTTVGFSHRRWQPVTLNHVRFMCAVNFRVSDQTEPSNSYSDVGRGLHQGPNKPIRFGTTISLEKIHTLSTGHVYGAPPPAQLLLVGSDSLLFPALDVDACGTVPRRDLSHAMDCM